MTLLTDYDCHVYTGWEKLVANDRFGIGYIGAGRRANQRMNLPPEGRIVAAADCDLRRAEAVAAARQCRAYHDYRELLDSKDIDAVFVATPDHWHVLHGIHACQAGKDIYLEKPLSLTIREGRIMVDAVRRYDRVLQTGSQRRSMSNHRLGCELVRNGLAGKIHTVTFRTGLIASSLGRNQSATSKSAIARPLSAIWATSPVGWDAASVGTRRRRSSPATTKPTAISTESGGPRTRCRFRQSRNSPFDFHGGPLPACLAGTNVWKATRSEAPQPFPHCPARRLRRRAGQ